jgi:alkylation response protein AidB-like acyl-CoA dehydrogenase
VSTEVELDTIEAEVTAWLDANWRPARPKQEWLELVVEAGYAVPTWPRQWFGRELDNDAAAVIAAAFRARTAPGARQDLHNLWANTALAFGTDSLKQRFIRPLLLDQVNMCLLYSEPGAGSDLAGLQTRADRDGDEWVVNGQKVWTSGAKKADYGMLIARTNWEVPKHQGISFFWFSLMSFSSKST